VDLKNLYYFVAVYEKQSFSAAAKVCFVAQPSISASIAQLEQTLNTRLFTRHARGVKATHSGKRLYPLAKQLLGQADAIKNVFRNHSSKQAFSLGVTRGLGVNRMSALLKDFTASQEQLELTLVPHIESCDARIVIKEELYEEEQFISIWQEDYLLALPYNHSLSLKKTISLTDLDGLPMVQRTPCTAWESLSDTLTLAGISVDIRAKRQTIDYALGLVRAGLGCALVPAHPDILTKSEVVFRAIDGIQLKRDILFAYQNISNVIENLKQLVNKHSQ
jgi:DNA-binding transcriptional LysR family regulator